MATSFQDTTTTNFTYNAANRLTAKGTRTFTYDNQGNQITDAGKTLGYSFDNQLKSYVNGALTTSYKYDASGNRIEKNQTGTGAVNYQYVNAGNNQVLITKNMTVSTSNFMVYGNDLISQGDAASTARQYYLTDGIGNVKYLTNSAGTILNTYASDPFGGNLTVSGTTANNFVYQTEQKDSESSLVYLRARYYDPSTGRFTSADPMSGMLGDSTTQNGYNYANNNPVNMMDPTGQFAIGDKLYNAFGLNDLRNTVASNCSGWSGIAAAEASAALKMSILIPAYGEVSAGVGALRGTATLSKVTKAEQLAVNAENGAAAEQAGLKAFQEAYGAQNVSLHGPGTSIMTPIGRRFPDLTVTTPNGIFLVEVKSGNAIRSATQLQKDAYIEKVLGIPTQVYKPF